MYAVIFHSLILLVFHAAGLIFFFVLISVTLTYLILFVYLDDVILIGNNPQLINKLVSHLRKDFAFKDLVDVFKNCFLFSGTKKH